MKKLIMLFLSLIVFFVSGQYVNATGEFASCEDVFETTQDGIVYEIRTCSFYDSSDPDANECQLKFKLEKNNHKNLKVYDTSVPGTPIKLDKNNSYKTCGSENFVIKFDNRIDTGLNDLKQLSVKPSGTSSDKFEVYGIYPPDENIKVRCSGLDYNIIVDKEDGWVCKIEIYSDNEGNVTMKYGNKEVKNPSNAINYYCEYAGDSEIFKLSKPMNKGSLNTSDDCPYIIHSGESEDDTPGQGNQTPERDSERSDDADTNIPGYNDDVTKPGELKNCDSIFKGDLQKYIEKIFSIMKYLGIVLCVGLSIVDFVKAILDNDKDILNKLAKKVLTRLFLVALLFFLPTIINFIVNLIDENACKINF